jgi:hypothetical protein
LRDFRTLHHPFNDVIKVNRDYSGADPWPVINMNQTGSWAYHGGQIRMPGKAKNRSV